MPHPLSFANLQAALHHPLREVTGDTAAQVRLVTGAYLNSPVGANDAGYFYVAFAERGLVFTDQGNVHA